MGIKIIIDSREKHPYGFKNSEIGALSIGDYSLPGLENHINNTTPSLLVGNGVQIKGIAPLIKCYLDERISQRQNRHISL